MDDGDGIWYCLLAGALGLAVVLQSRVLRSHDARVYDLEQEVAFLREVMRQRDALAADDD